MDHADEVPRLAVRVAWSAAPGMAEEMTVELPVGATLVDDWSIDRLTIGERGFIITLRGGAGNARFEVTCAASEHTSPFDFGAAHIFYSNDVPFDWLEEAGKALRETVRRAAGEVEVCDAIATWCASPGS